MFLKRLLWAAVIFGALPLLFAVMIFFESTRPDEQGMRLFLLLLIAPWPICAMLLHRVLQKEKLAFNAGVHQIGGASHHYFKEGWGIAINPSQRKILVADEKGMQIYAFDQIRGWVKSSQDGGLVFGGGLAGGVANTGRLIDNARNTGLRIDVIDIDRPNWMIRMGRQNDRDRWFEILRQSINEGTLA